MLRKRIITSVICLPIFLALIWFGNPWFTLAIATLSAFAILEFYKIARKMDIEPLTYFGTVVTVLLCLSPYYPAANIKLLIILLTIPISLVWQLFVKNEHRKLNNSFWTIGGILYLGLLTSYWAEIPGLNNGRWWLFWSILVVVVCDIAAFFTGRSVGRHLLAPNISPKKTWEGAIAGVLASTLLGIILDLIFSLPVSLWLIAILALFVGIISQFGDLIESLLKRNAGIKDSGNFFPGHGGVLDRIDSYILIGPIVYYFVIYFVL